MNSVTLKLIATLALFAAVAAPFRLTAQVGQKQVHYQLVDLGTLGGSQGNAYGGVTNRRWVTGDSNLPGDQNEHAFLWRNGKMQDLGTLGGPNSSTASVIKNNAGFIMGIAQIAELDPRAEYWGSGFFCTTVNCQGFKYLDRGFLWKDGEMTALPTLGGNNSQAYGVNSRGQVVGLAEKANAAIPACAPPQLLEFQAVVWSPGEDEIQVLPPLPGDAIGAALAINDSGQVVGGSGVCGVPFSNVLAHAVLWQDGKPIDLGNFGGVIGPNLVGWLKDSTGSFEAGLYAMAGCALISASVTLIAVQAPPRRVEPKIRQV